VREFLGDRCTPQLRDPRWAVSARPDGGVSRDGARVVQPHCAVDDAGWRAFVAMLNATDVVGTTDQFDSFWLTLAGAPPPPS
jgi:hypothetical protein